MTREDIELALARLSIVGDVSRESGYYDNMAYAIVYPENNNNFRIAVWASLGIDEWQVDIELFKLGNSYRYYVARSVKQSEMYEVEIEKAIILFGWLNNVPTL